MTTKDAIKSALYTALWTFVSLFLISLLGWIQQVAAWASASGHAPLPGLSVLGYAFVAAFASAASGLVALAVRLAQAKGKLPGNGPTFTPPPPPPVELKK